MDGLESTTLARDLREGMRGKEAGTHTPITFFEPLLFIYLLSEKQKDYDILPRGIK